MRSEHFLNPSNLFDDMKEEQGGRREGRGCGRVEKGGRGVKEPAIKNEFLKNVEAAIKLLGWWGGG